MINWHFIEELEGAAVATGYVPLDKDGKPLGKSGVTIASGVDLGQRSASDWQRLAIHEATLEMIRPYCGVKGDAAVALLNERPLVLGEAHVAELDNCLRAEFLRTVSERFNSASGRVRGPTWDDLSDREQTVVMSVAWQYGTPWKRCPTFWGHATAGRWDDVIAELRDFGDAYPTRRGKEADYLEGKHV
jgi:hypothetical protein